MKGEEEKDLLKP